MWYMEGNFQYYINPPNECFGRAWICRCTKSSILMIWNKTWIFPQILFRKRNECNKNTEYWILAFCVWKLLINCHELGVVYDLQKWLQILDVPKTYRWQQIYINQGVTIYKHNYTYVLCVVWIYAALGVFEAIDFIIIYTWHDIWDKSVCRETR